jgi:hypothetical protein
LAQAAGRGQRAGLVGGDENPADDTASLPYPSTQILLWHTAMRPAAREGELGIGDLGLTAQADTVRAAIRDRFACPGPFGSQWAYETDGHRRHRRYHDANHLPTALAPLWGPVPTRRRPRLRHAGRAAPGDQATGWSATGSELCFRPMLTARTGMLAGEELSPCARVSLPASRTTPDSAGFPDNCNACSAGRPGVNLALGGERVGQRVDGEAEWSCRGSCGALPTRQ